MVRRQYGFALRAKLGDLCGLLEGRRIKGDAGNRPVVARVDQTRAEHGDDPRARPRQRLVELDHLAQGAAARLFGSGLFRMTQDLFEHPLVHQNRTLGTELTVTQFAHTELVQ